MTKLKNILAAALTAAICVVPTYGVTTTATSISSEGINREMTTTVGAETYTIDTMGNVYYVTGDGTVAANGIADDQCLYDENGIQVNTLSYVRDKYYDAFDAAEDEDIIWFDSQDETFLFINWYQLEKASEQGKNFTIYSKDGKYGIKKRSFNVLRRGYGDAYFAKKTELLEGIDPTWTAEEKINYLTRQVADSFVYDENYMATNLETAISDGRGVCYHFGKLLKGVLDGIGIESEYVCGELSGDALHVWLKVTDPETGKYLYKDATAVNIGIRDGLFHIDNYAGYIASYRMAGFDESYLKIFS